MRSSYVIEVFKKHFSVIIKETFYFNASFNLVSHTAMPNREMVFTLFGNMLLAQNLMLKTMVLTDLEKRCSKFHNGYLKIQYGGHTISSKNMAFSFSKCAVQLVFCA